MPSQNIWTLSKNYDACFRMCTLLLIVNGPQCTSKQFLSTRLINLDGAASQSISATHNKRHLKIEPLCFSSLLHNWWLAGSKIKLQNLNANCRAASKGVIFSYSCTVDSQGTNFLATFKISFLYFCKIEIIAFGFIFQECELNLVFTVFAC